MVEITKLDNVLEVYASPKELPIPRYKAMQLFILQDTGIGSDMHAVDTRLQSLMMFAGAGAEKLTELHTELHNLRFTFFSLIKGLDYKTRSFACLVAKINGIEYNDISDDGLAKVAAEIERIGFSVEELDEHFSEVKKKLILN